MFGTQEYARNIRREVVRYVVNHYHHYGNFITYHLNGKSMTCEQYEAYMLLPTSYATFVEVVAASIIFKIRIIVFCGQEEFCDVGRENLSCVVSMFSGDRDSGHFDLLQPINLPFPLTPVPYISSENFQQSSDENVIKKTAITSQLNPSNHNNIEKLPKLTNSIIIADRIKNKPGRPTKNKRGRPIQSNESQRNINSKLRKKSTVQASKVTFSFRKDLCDESSVIEHSLGAMNSQCVHCHSFHFAAEATNGHFNSCCHNGLIFLPEPKINTELKELFSCPTFVNNIRKYNSAMAFASFSATRKEIPGRGPYCFKIQGQIHRYISDLIPRNGEAPSYGQLYFIDSSVANDTRISRNENRELSLSILSVLENVLAGNPYALAYKTAADAIKLEPKSLNLDLHFVDNISMDKRIFNKPTADEIAGVFNSMEGEPPGYRHVVVHNRKGGPKLLSVMSPHCDPMLYPLLFPYGEPGWDAKMTHNGPRKQKKRERLTMLQFACYRLAIRRSFSHIHQSKKLFQQYIVDLYVRVEGERLHYIRQHQSELRVEHYKGLQDFVVQRAQLGNLAAGKIIVLPSSFEGSPRNMTQRYQDAMAIVRKFGKPDIFLTMTCNPKWPEITSELGTNEKYEYRPDIVSRVFCCKLNDLKNDLLNNNVLGVIVAHVYVIEFQKRGLPHCHMLLILNENSKFREPADIDRCVQAELPDPTRFPTLYNKVVSNMVHGPCGVRQPDAPCMKDGKCTKNFPKEFSKDTVENYNGYPKYRRRDNGITAQKKGYQIDSRDVVPYNAYLLLKYNAHINVEICSSVRSVKYLFKYVYKGYDSACMEFVRKANKGDDIEYDEIITYANMRYVSSHECIWRLHSNEMHEQSHTIIRLAVHEPGYHNVYFRAGEEENALLASKSKRTSLTAWFDLNRCDPNAHQYLYTDIPQHYRLSDNKWILRKRGGSKVIGRMYGVAPNDLNRFYLRMLLLHVRGATSFEDLLCYNGLTYATFKEAAFARGLLQDDNEWCNCLDEMQSTHMPRQMRELFAYICCFCEPTSPYELWIKFKFSMTEDMEGHNERENENLALQKIDLILRGNGLDCSSIGLPAPTNLQPNEIPFVMDDQADRGANMYCCLNEEQKKVVDKVMSSISGETEEKLFFLEAPGGCGKTFVYSCILCLIRGRGQTALAAAWTGIAALLLDGGTTLHRLFGLPVPVIASSVSSITANSDRAKILREASIIVIDEASMVPAAAVDCMDRLLKDIMKCKDPLLGNIPMGGKVILFGGDFRQVLPVVPRAGKVEILEACIQTSKVWKFLVTLHLTRNMRTSADQQEFSKWLLQLGNGKIHSNQGNDIIEIPANFISEENVIIQNVFGDSLATGNANDYLSRVIMCPLNEDCSKLNSKVMNLISGDSKEYVSVDSIISDDPAENLNIPLEYLNSITPSGLPPHKLTLKVGVVVMLIRNMNLGAGLVNGVRMLVRGVMEKCVKLEVVTGVGRGNIVFLPRIKLISTDPNMPFSMSRIQFPLRLAFAITVNKAQGQTFHKIGICLPKPVFSHGQLYVAFSRVKGPADVQVVVNKTSEQGQIGDKIYTKNIVYTEVLL